MGRVRRHRILRRLLKEIRQHDPRVQVLVAKGMPRDAVYQRVFGQPEEEA
jgi:hypothetical protein